MPTYNTPGVYIEEIPTFPPSVAGVQTAVPAFIGYTNVLAADTKLHMIPTKVFSLQEYVDNFGLAQAEDNGLSVQIVDTVIKERDGAGAIVPGGKVELVGTTIEASLDEAQRSYHIMYYSLKLYFENGGGPCYIISVGPYSADQQTVDAGDLKDGLAELKNIDEPTLIVIPELFSFGSKKADYDDVVKTALDQAAELKDRFAIIDVLQAATKTAGVNADITDFQDNRNIGDNGRYGAAYYPNIQTTIDYNYFGFEDSITISHTVIDDEGVSTAGDLDGDLLSAIESTNNLTFQSIKSALSNYPLTLPSSPAVAGIYAKVDRNIGVWKAPANVAIGLIVKPSVKINDALQDIMNVHPAGGKSVNAIRTLTGRGTLIWGARTLDGNDNEWRYISVRRFFNFVEESIQKATYRFVFEPNDANTWATIKGMIESFLTIQWRQGALQGSKPEDAFFVNIGLGQTMTAQDILEGRLIVDIGMAVVRPAEFIILRFMHKLPEG